MDAAPFLKQFARALAGQKLEAILIGNAAAALRGAPVTTIDLDFLFRPTPRNIAKLKAVAREMDAVLLRPFYPVSGMIRMSRDGDGLQVDFMTKIHGIRSFEALRARSSLVDVDGEPLQVAELSAIIESKEAAGRPQDKAVLGILKKSLREAKKTEP